MKPKKSLGQNFLTSKKAIFEIVKAGEININETVLEVGPGKGALTEELLKVTKKVVAIEKDSDLVTFLEEKFKKEISDKRLILIKGDILLEKINLKNYKVIANIPYYITGAIIEKFLEEKEKPIKMVLLVQKEVAERMVARDKKESILSLATKFYGTPKIVYKVSAGSFFPKPKVDSAVISIDINNQKTDKKLEEKYLKLVKLAFSHKRKIMLGNIKNEYKEKNLEEIFKFLNLNIKTRAEDLTKEDFISLAKNL